MARRKRAAESGKKAEQSAEQLSEQAEQLAEQSAGKGRTKKKAATDFQPGQSGNPGGKPKARDTKQLPLVRAMRLVMNTEASNTESPQCVHLRSMMEEDQQRFLDRLIKLEAEERAARKVTVPPGTVNSEVKPDETTAELVELIDKLLSDEPNDESIAPTARA